ncbi:MAG: DUF2306 domain-containing protein [Planctomycetota bacterium]|jgi:hypothetical protein
MNRIDSSGLAPAQRSGLERRTWIVPTLLLLWALVPAGGGIYRVLSLVGGAEVTAANQRFFDAPVPVLLHGVACALFAFTGAFQFTEAGRRNPVRHRVRGMVFAPSALVVAATGLWMEATYELPAHDGLLLSWFRALAGTAMLLATMLGMRALLRREFALHGAWMLRAYVLGMGAGTQVLLFLPWALFMGEATVEQRAWLMGAGWGINALVAEVLIRRRSRRRAEAGLLAAGVRS